MAKEPCFNYKGQHYLEPEFKAELAAGELDKLISDGVVKDLENKPVEVDPTVRERKEETKRLKDEILSAEPDTPRQMVMQFFLGGGRIKTSNFKKETRFTKGQEFNQRIWAHSEQPFRMAVRDKSGRIISFGKPIKPYHIDDLVQIIKEMWSDYHGGELDDQDVRNEIIDVLNSYEKPAQMYDDLRKEFSDAQDNVIKDKLERQVKKYEDYQALQAEQHVPEEDIPHAHELMEEIDQSVISEEDAQKAADQYDEWFNTLSPEEQQHELQQLQYENDKITPSDYLPEGAETQEAGSAGNVDAELRKEQQERLSAAKQSLDEATSLYNRLNARYQKDLKSREVGMGLEKTKGKQISSGLGVGDLAKDVADAKTKMEEAQREVDKLQKVVDENLKGQADLFSDEAKQALKGEDVTPTVDRQVKKDNKKLDDEWDFTPPGGLALNPVQLVSAFLKEDVFPTIASIGNGLKDGFTKFRNVVNPTQGVSKKALDAIMKTLGARQKGLVIVDKILRDFEKMFNKFPEEERIDFIDRMKRGEPQKSDYLDQVADLLKGMDKDLYESILDYKPTLAWKENHFRVLWKTVPGAADKKGFKGLFKKPLQGSKGFMKQATLTDMSEGIDKGGVPYSTNPITMFKMSYADAMKFITAQRLWQTFKDQGFAKFVRFGTAPPEGFVRLDDSISKVYFPVKEGLVQAGEYYVDEGAGRLLNNYLSKDRIRQSDFGKGLMELKNIYTQVELGFSMFHAVAESFEVSSSQIGLGLRKLINLGLAKGDAMKAFEGVKDILTAPLASFTTAKEGDTAIKVLSQEQFKNSPAAKAFMKKYPDADTLLDDLFTGGGTLKVHEDYKLNSLDTFKNAIDKKNYLGATLRALPAANQLLTIPLFEYYIPRLKVGMFLKEYSTALLEKKDALDTNKTTREEVARDTWQFVEDRLGEMNFDTLFWNNTFKTANQFLFRSVTWKLGNLRAMGGAPIEQSMEFYKAAKEKRAPQLSPKVAWLLGLTAFQAAAATILMRMTTGNNPQTIKDLVAPQVNKDDPNSRVMMPTYYKDLLHLKHEQLDQGKVVPTDYLTSSVSGDLERLIDIWKNKDFYGYEIYDTEGSLSEKAKEAAEYFIPKPFSISSFIESEKKGDSKATQAMSFFGFNKAPAYLSHTPIDNEIFDLYHVRNSGVKPYGQKKANEVKKKVANLYKADRIEEATKLINESIEEGTITAKKASELIKGIGKKEDASVYMFKRLPYEDKIYLRSKMSDEEKTKYTLPVPKEGVMNEHEKGLAKQKKALEQSLPPVDQRTEEQNQQLSDLEDQLQTAKGEPGEKAYRIYNTELKGLSGGDYDDKLDKLQENKKISSAVRKQLEALKPE